MTTTGATPWVAAHEGYYGPPLSHEARIDLVRWLGDHGFDGYAYSPKDDALNRARWREPYPPEDMDRFAELQAACESADVELAMMVSPGLDWRSGDPAEIDALVAKLKAFAEVGAPVLSVNWDDVPGTGADAGAEHGRAVAEASERVDAEFDGEIAWMTCPVDYATASPTEYLGAFAATVPDHVDVAWTGPSVVTSSLGGSDVEAIEQSLGHRIAFCENFPVNDLGMAQVLHLGPYPERDTSLVRASRRVFVNFMHLPVASRVGLAVAERFWHGSDSGREADWEAAIAEVPGLEPLARACRSWMADPGPDPVLAAWVEAALDGDDRRLEEYLVAGCRDGLPADLAAEVEPWLAQWDAEATAMRAALTLLRMDRPPDVAEIWTSALTWEAARRGRPQCFGIRFALYPATRRDGDRLVAGPGVVVRGDNLTDRLWSAVLDRLGLVLS